VARALLGCVLVSRRGRARTAGRIVETEAYLGPEDQASHAAFRPASRSLFYGPGGRAYVFVSYGVHHCLNAIAGPAGRPGCVLLRALEALAGVETMARRRGVDAGTRRLASGPGNLTRALGVSLRDNGGDLTRGPLVILPPDRPRDFGVARGPRVGITRSVARPLRFWITGHPAVSRGAGARKPTRGVSARGAGRRDRRARQPGEDSRRSSGSRRA
jgi:DNA-3-methyladenine glycosylase